MGSFLPNVQPSPSFFALHNTSQRVYIFNISQTTQQSFSKIKSCKCLTLFSSQRFLPESLNSQAEILTEEIYAK